MPILRFHRKAAFADLFVSYDIEVDQKRIDALWSSSKRCIPISVGEHSIQITNGCFKSKMHFVKISSEHEYLIECGPEMNHRPISNNLLSAAIAFRTDDFYDDSIWVKISELPPNNSFKPKPLRGLA